MCDQRQSAGFIMFANIDDNRVALAITPVLRLAFRPFFLLGALFSIVCMAWWIHIWLSPSSSSWTPYGSLVWWHAHEMVFGFAPAVVAGFLLTAVQNWTGVPGLRGKLLAVLVLTWLIGRIVIAFGSYLPSSIVIAGDLLFLPCAAAAMAYPVLKVKMWRNFIFVPVLLMMALLNAVSHWGVQNDKIQVSLQVMHAAIMLITFVVAFIGGRVIPMFTANGTGAQRISPIKWLELASLFSLLLVIIVMMLGYDTSRHPLVTLLFAVTAFIHSWRFLRMGFWQCWKVPLLWSLHLAFSCIPLGLIALTLYSAGLLDNYSAALHCFSVGAIGGMILSMTSRVILGHTGRPLQPPKPMAIAFVLILLSALIRVIIPSLFPAFMSWGIVIAGLCWIMAYGIFCFYYAPMLTTARLDGRPG